MPSSFEIDNRIERSPSSQEQPATRRAILAPIRSSDDGASLVRPPLSPYLSAAAATSDELPLRPMRLFSSLTSPSSSWDFSGLTSIYQRIEVGGSRLLHL